MVYGFVLQVGGTATIESVPGKGTTVSLYLPRTLGQPDMHRQAETAGPAPVENLRILIVDDDDSVRSLTKEMLEDMGHEVADAPSGRSALDQLKAGPPCDLLLVDFAMPMMNGSECAAEARMLRPDLPVLFITGYVNNDALRSWSALGFRTLNKPFHYADLAEAVHQASRPPPQAGKVIPLRAR
jgi:CheY-like chemotaxis protein